MTARVWAFLKWLVDPRWFWDPDWDKRTIPMKADAIPLDAKGRPDLSKYTEPVTYYVAMYDAFLKSFERPLSRHESNLAWRQRVHATWGLIAHGSESIPYALKLLRHKVSDARETGAEILHQVGAAPHVTDDLIAALRSEADDVARTSVIEALGYTQSPEALRVLEQVRGQFISDPDSLDAIDRSVARLRA